MIGPRLFRTSPWRTTGVILGVAVLLAGCSLESQPAPPPVSAPTTATGPTWPATPAPGGSERTPQANSQASESAVPAVTATPSEAKPTEAPKASEAPKPEAPKPSDAPKPEAPKPEAPKPDAPKPEAPKPDAPKPPAQPEPPKADGKATTTPLPSIDGQSIPEFGACVNMTTDDKDITRFVSVGCSTSHKGQIVGYVDLSDQPAHPPTVTTLNTIAGWHCKNLGGAFIHQTLAERGGLAISWTAPTRTQWQAGARAMVCVITGMPSGSGIQTAPLTSDIRNQ